MDNGYKVGDKVTLSYLSKFGTGRKAVLNGAVTAITDDGITIKIGVREDYVKWDDVLGLAYA